MAKKAKQPERGRDRLEPEERGVAAGNAQRLPGEQTCREDLPAGEQETCNEPARGSANPRGVTGALLPVDEDAQRGDVRDARSERNAQQDIESAHLPRPELVRAVGDESEHHYASSAARRRHAASPGPSPGGDSHPRE
jgi:hypothetical protein